MPLIKGKSPQSFSKNVKIEMENGKPQKQALAIAYNIRRKAKGMANGGAVKPMPTPHADNCQSCGSPISKETADKFAKGLRGYAEGGEVMSDEEPQNEPMGDTWLSDEFLATPKGEMTGNHHSEFNSETGMSDDNDEDDAMEGDSTPDPEVEDHKARVQRVMRSYRKHRLINR